ncbi:MAG: hypothetical protein RLZZ584_4242 [Pseudomonadota bacterium]
MANRIAVVDTSIANYSEIISQIAPGIEVIVIDAAQDGWSQLAGLLAGYTDITTLDIISHGADGSVWLGNQALDSSNLGQHAQALADIGSHLAVGADVMLYGCNIGADIAGQGFITALGQALNADVAASIDLTGSAQLGGNWTLETQNAGAVIEAAPLALDGFTGLLAGNLAPTAGDPLGGSSHYTQAPTCLANCTPRTKV